MFWTFAFGILLGVGMYYLATRPNLKLAWYDWVLLVVASIFLIIGVNDFLASFQELAPTAAWLLLFSFGIPALILYGIVAFRLRRQGRQTQEPIASAE